MEALTSLIILVIVAYGFAVAVEHAPKVFVKLADCIAEAKRRGDELRQFLLSFLLLFMAAAYSYAAARIVFELGFDDLGIGDLVRDLYNLFFAAFILFGIGYAIYLSTRRRLRGGK